MLNKKAQGMPVNVIIIAIIVLVVLVILIAFFAGGFGSIAGKVKEVFSIAVGMHKDRAINACQDYCANAQSSPAGSAAQRQSSYCKASFLVDDDGNSDTIPVRMNCGPNSAPPTLSATEEGKGIKAGGNLGVDCEGINTCI